MFKIKGLTASGELIDLGDEIISASSLRSAKLQAKMKIRSLAEQHPNLHGIRITDELGRNHDVYMTRRTIP